MGDKWRGLFPCFKKQILFNKVYDGGLADDDSALIVPKNTSAKLATIEPTEAMLAYDTDLQMLVIDSGSGFGPLSASAASEQDGGSVNLGSAASYALLAASAITNSASAPSVVSGNLGITPNNQSSVTGFPPASVINGSAHYADASAEQAKADAQAAFTAMNALPATAIPAVLDGQTLAPGVYEEASGTFSLAEAGNGTLTLNGAGTYIFQAASTLRTGAGGVPTFAYSGGASASNTHVYWAVGSSATINIGVSSANSIFKGTIIAQASITVTQGGATGRLLALTGAVTLSNATNLSGTAVSSPKAVASSGGNILALTSALSVGGAASEALVVSGLMATDTVLSVSQKTPGAVNLPILGWTTVANNALTVQWVADPGPGARIVIAVKR